MEYTKVRKLIEMEDVKALLAPGTICTPIALVEEIVEKLNVKWDNPNLKILDPACGRGVFLLVVKWKLLQFHSEQHIIENMLYGIDISQGNVDVATQVINPKYKNNIICADALTWETSLKFDVIVGNPPYDKNGKDEPLYYKFLRQYAQQQQGTHASFIIPSGWLVGPKAESFRTFIFNNFNISHMKYVTNETFKENGGDILQPTVVVTSIIGSPTTKFTFQRFAGGLEYSTVVNRETDIYPLGMPLYVGELSKELVRAAMSEPTKFATKTGMTESPCVNVGPANMSGYYLSTLPISWYVQKIIYAIEASVGCSNKDRVFHPCQSITDAHKLKQWLGSAGARLIMAMWATSYRNTRSNIGQIPALITIDEYSNSAAYNQLGLSDKVQTWLLSMDSNDNQPK